MSEGGGAAIGSAISSLVYSILIIMFWNFGHNDRDLYDLIFSRLNDSTVCELETK